MKNSVHDTCDLHHHLWLIYCQLKDAEAEADRSTSLLEKCRLELAQIINVLARDLISE